MYKYISSLLLIFLAAPFFAQEVIEIKTLNFDSSSKRDTMVDFPDVESEKIIMRYTMRCKDGLVSNSNDRNRGCGEWDYSCNTFITDSSRIDSFIAKAPSHIISNFSDVIFYYVNNATHTYYKYDLKQVNVQTVVAEAKKTVGSGSKTLMGEGNQEAYDARIYYLYKKDDLGAFAGKITGLELALTEGLGRFSKLKVKMKEVDAAELNMAMVNTTGMQQVFFNDVDAKVGENNRLQFYDPFTWSGTKNILIEVSYNNINNDVKVAGDETNYLSSLASVGPDRYLSSNGSFVLDIPASEATAISKEITVAFWARGNADVLPANTVAIEGQDNAGNRQLMVHLPWSNSNVFFDCGNDGTGYNRINKAATESEFEGKWQYWAFTKNVTTGSMKIYLNGKLWHSGTGNTKAIDLRKLSFAGSLARDGFYYGDLDDLTIWNKELDATTILSNMQQNIDASHPLYGNLVYQYNFDEANGLMANDKSSSSTVANFNTNPARFNFLPTQKFKQYALTMDLPKLTFVKGTYTQTVNTIVALDSVANLPNLLRTFYVENNDLKEADTKDIWEAKDQKVYDENGNLIEEIFVEADSIIYIEDLRYYQKRPMKFELVSFVTPYGIGLDFGLGGKSWDIDVSDFAPILKGRKRLNMDFGGQNQEEMDIRFLFYKGSAPAKVNNIRQLWPVNAVAYTNILNNSAFESRNVTLTGSTKFAKIRAAITGHGQEGEFIARNHFVNVNGGNAEWTWQVWKECANNPIYPQGGTWIYDRAGWCPGAATDVNEFNATPYIGNGTMAIDYGLSTAAGDSRYIVNCQLVEYGEARFVNDAAISTIISPSKSAEFVRYNPMCTSPIIEIKNTGNTTLTKLTIRYGVEGGTSNTMQWTGTLKFMERTKISLPVLAAGNYLDEGIFYAEVSAPNGEADGYEPNNRLTSSFNGVKKFQADVIIQMRTNGAYEETSWVLTDASGNTIRQRKGGLTPNTLYVDTIKNLGGCYYLKVSDTDDDGISFWANGDGNGSISIRNFTGSNQTFNGDFGKEINFQFVAGDVISDITEIETTKEVMVYPNPVSDMVQVVLQGYKEDGEVQITDVSGRVLSSKKFNGFGFHEMLFDLSSAGEGIYFVHVMTAGGKVVKKVVKM